ncbi:ImmA/IrrE family metallo-endopeptidase [Leuconostoc mesenteroides]|uniref:ImmA/IrrE family metallo-endopeptidase n=1 Tax=Leuconostoc mesenteroides TaxID=1245 RepID=UPI002362BB0C|nr:ImmA/IrrE family metallo-endopeptidase [Leuconostoc mesenteroides]
MYIDDRISNYLEQIVQKNGLTLIHIDGTELDPDVANGRKRAIIINNNYKTNFSRYFRIAHEISHLIYARSNDTYAFSPLSKLSDETEANLHAIQILVDFYFSEIPLKQKRWERRFHFIEAFGLGQITHLVEKILA